MKQRELHLIEEVFFIPDQSGYIIDSTSIDSRHFRFERLKFRLALQSCMLLDARLSLLGMALSSSEITCLAKSTLKY